MPTSAPFKKPKAIEEDVLEVLRSMEWPADDRCVIPGQCSIYPKVKKVLEALGGKWNRSAKAIIFSDGGQDRIIDAIATGVYLDAKQAWQFYETPASVAEIMARKVYDHYAKVFKQTNRVPRDLTVLEPSAGTGAIMTACLARGFGVDAIEMNSEHLPKLNSECLCGRDAGRMCTVTIADFLKIRPESQGTYAAVVMNPPFTGLADIAHVRHAWDFVKPGGILVAITSPSWTFRNDRRCKEFFEFVRSQADYSIQHMPEGTFAAAGTNVNTVMLTIEKSG